MSLFTALMGTRSNANIRSRGEALHLAGHTIGFMAFGRHFAFVAGASDLCGLEPPALCPDGPDVTDFERAVIVAAGRCAEAYSAQPREVSPIGGVPEDIIRSVTRIEVGLRSLADYDDDLFTAANLSGSYGSDLSEVVEVAVDLIADHWAEVSRLADAFDAAAGSQVDWNDIYDLVGIIGL